MMRAVHLYCGSLVLCLSVVQFECICRNEYLVASDTPQYITTSAIPECQNKYMSCEWVIRAPSSSKIHIKVIRNINWPCRYGDHVRVYNGEMFSEDWRLLGLFCGFEQPNFESQDSVVTIKLSKNYSCTKSFELEYRSVDITEQGRSAWGWKEMLIILSCGVFLLVVFSFIKKYMKSRHQRRTDMEMRDVIVNTAVTSDGARANHDESTANQLTAPPPKYDDVIKNDEEAPPRYSSLLQGGKINPVFVIDGQPND